MTCSRYIMLSDWGRIQSEWSSIINVLLSEAARTQSHTIIFCGNTVGTWLECFRKRARSIQRNNNIGLYLQEQPTTPKISGKYDLAGFYTTYINENCCLFLCKHISLWRDWAKSTKKDENPNWWRHWEANSITHWWTAYGFSVSNWLKKQTNWFGVMNCNMLEVIGLVRKRVLI